MSQPSPLPEPEPVRKQAPAPLVRGVAASTPEGADTGAAQPVAFSDLAERSLAIRAAIALAVGGFLALSFPKMSLEERVREQIPAGVDAEKIIEAGRDVMEEFLKNSGSN